jgi:hypothetical protein
MAANTVEARNQAEFSLAIVTPHLLRYRTPSASRSASHLPPPDPLVSKTESKICRCLTTPPLQPNNAHMPYLLLNQPNSDTNGLISLLAQYAASGQVLTATWMNL